MCGLFSVNITQRIYKGGQSYYEADDICKRENKRDILSARRIGTGSIGLAGNGRLVDWEIFNRPSKGSVNGYTHFAIKASRDGVTRDARVICGDVYKNLAGQTGMNFGFGLSNTTMEGFPHFRNCEFKGEFPIAELSFSDPDSPFCVKLTAFNPFIPQNDRDSSIPAAFFELLVRNNSYETLDISIAATLKNPFGGSVNKYFEDGKVKGILLGETDAQPDTPEWGELALATDGADISYQENWYRGSWFDNLETYWRNFTEHERFNNRTYENPGNGDHATIAVHGKIKSRGWYRTRFVIAWYNPLKPDQWKNNDEEPMKVPNYYSYLFDGAAHARSILSRVGAALARHQTLARRAVRVDTA